MYLNIKRYDMLVTYYICDFLCQGHPWMRTENIVLQWLRKYGIQATSKCHSNLSTMGSSYVRFVLHFVQTVAWHVAIVFSCICLILLYNNGVHFTANILGQQLNWTRHIVNIRTFCRAAAMGPNQEQMRHIRYLVQTVGKGYQQTTLSNSHMLYLQC